MSIQFIASSSQLPASGASSVPSTGEMLIISHVFMSSSEQDTGEEVKIIENAEHNKTYQRGLSELMRLSTERRHKWRSRSEFVLASLTYLIGYDSTFTFLRNFCYTGGISIIPFVVVLLIYGMPMMYLEMSLGQFSSLDPPLLFRRISPAFAAIGYVSCLVSFLSLMGSQSVLLICFEIISSAASMLINNYLDFASCHKYYNTADCIEPTQHDCNATVHQPMNGGCVRFANTPNPQLVYLVNQTRDHYLNYRKTAAYQLILQKLFGSYNMRNLDAPTLGLLFWLGLSWALCVYIAKRGISFVCLVSYFNAIGFAVLLSLVFVCGVVLDGGLGGLSNFFTFDTTHLYDPVIWVDTFIYFAVCFKLGQGGLIILGSYNKFHENIFYEVTVIAVGAFVCPFLMVFAITPLYSALFKVLANGQYVPTEQYENAMHAFSGGDGMVVSTVALSLVPGLSGGFTTIFAVLILFLVLGNQMMRLVLLVSSLRENFFMCHNKFYLNASIYLFCMIGFLISFLFMTQFGGINYYVCHVILVPLLCAAVSFYETVTVAHCYGSKKLFTNIHAMFFGKRENDRTGGLWKLVPYFNAYMMMCWGYVTPLFIATCFTIALAAVMQYALTMPADMASALWTLLIVFLAIVAIVPVYALYRLAYAFIKRRSKTMLLRPNLMLWGPRRKKHRVLAQTSEERWGVS